jgi:hypothetical protein
MDVGKDINGTRLTFLLRPSRGRQGVEPWATPPATEYDSASSIGDQLEVMSLAGTEPEMEEMSHRHGEEGATNTNVASARAADEHEAETDRGTDSGSRMQSLERQYRRTQSILADMRKPAGTCATGLGRGQSLWSFVFA